MTFLNVTLVSLPQKKGCLLVSDVLDPTEGAFKVL